MVDRLGMPVSVSSAPRGLIAGRWIKSLAIAKGDALNAHAFAEAQTYKGFWRDTPAVVSDTKAAVTAMETGAAMGTPTAISDFLGMVRARALIDRITGWHRAPLNTSLLVFSGDATGYIVGQNAPKPIGAFDLARVALAPRKASAITVLTDETLRHADPTTELGIGAELARAAAAAMDRMAFDPDLAGSIPHGGNVINSTGSTLAAIDNDLRAMLAFFATADDGLDGAVFIMSSTTATYLGSLRGSGGAPAFPLVGARGGSILQIPVFVSAAMRAAGSPGEAAIILLDPRQVLVGDEAQAEITFAKDASIEMDGAPTGGAASLVSLWQNNLIAIRAERWFAAQRASDGACVTLDNVAY